MKIKYRYVLLCAAPPLLFWLLDGMMDYLYFYEGPILELLLTNIPPHELYVRSLTGGLLAVSGAAFAYLYSRMEECANRYRNFFRTCRDAAFITSRDGKWVEVNETLIDLFGYESREGLMAQPVRKAYADPLEREKYMELVTEEGFVRDHPLKLRKKDGTVMETLVTAAPAMNENGEMVGLQGTVRNVTEQKRMERQLRRNERKYRSIFELSPEAIVLLDSEARVIDVNDRLKDWLGYHPEEVKGKRLSELPYLTQKDKEKTLKKFHQRMSGEQPEPYEVEFMGRNGERYIGLVRGTRMEGDTGTPATDLVMISNITRRKRDEQKIQQLNSLLRALRRVNKIIVTESSLQEVAQKACDALLQAREYIGCSVALPREETETMTRIAGAGEPPIGEEWSVPANGNGASPECVKEAIRTSKIVTTPAGEACESCPEDERHKQHNVTIVPMQKDGETKGLLLVSAAAEQEFDMREEALLKEIAQDLTFAKGKLEAEGALKESEKKYRELVQNAKSIIMRMDLEGNVTFINDFGQQFFGYSEEEILGENVIGTIVPKTETTGRDLRAMIRDIGKNPTDYAVNENENMRKDGERVWVAWTNKPVHDRDGDVSEILSVGYDVTDRKMMEKTLRQSKRRLNNMIHNIPGVAYRCHNEPGWPMEVWATGGTRLTGYDAEELWPNGDVSYESIIHPDDQERVWNQVQEAVQKERTFEVEYRIITRSDEQKWVLERGTPVNEQESDEIVLEGIITDVTDRKQAQKELRESEQRFRVVIENLPYAVVAHDLDGKILMVNETTCKNTGYSRNELLGMSVEEIDSRIREREDRKEIWTKLEEGQSFQIESVHQRKDGSTYPAEIALNPISLSDERVVLVVAADISKRKQAQEELRRSQQKHLEQERRRALTQMASGIAHDFNNILGIIKGSTQLLLDVSGNLDDRDKVERFVRRIDEAAGDAAETVKKMRKFYKPQEQSSVKLVDLNNCIHTVVDRTAPRWREEARAGGAPIEVKKNLSSIPRLYAKEAEIHELLTNLIFNAVDAMPEGGTLEFATRSGGDKVIMEVSDTGEGMDETVQEQCLTPFFTTKGANGSGLGLSTVKGVVERHNGNIEIESTKDEGTTFHITLPIGESSETDTEEKAHGETAPIQPITVLLIEDEKKQRQLLKEYMEHWGHTVHTAENGRVGLEKFNPEDHELVITDRSMPNLSGDRVAAKVKEKAFDTPLIMLTGFGDMMEARGERPTGVDSLLSKPVNTEELWRCIRRLFAEYEVSS